MRHLAVAVLAAGTLFAAQPAQAQTYAGLPVCLHVYGPVTYYECNYTTLASCNATASGRAAQCILNPYYANAGMDGPPVRHRRHRGY
jgi:hypothetical protein